MRTRLRDTPGMLTLIAAAALAAPEPAAFPERSPGLIEACLVNAIEAGQVSDTDDSHKYMCLDDAAQRLWNFLKDSKVAAYDQDTGAEGRWQTRDFPLGGCFKRTHKADGSKATDGLSCSIWIPRPRAK